MHSASEFLKHYENVNPLPTNLAFYDVWADDAREQWDLQIGEGQGHLEAVLNFRKTFLEESFLGKGQGQGQQTSGTDDTWKWLITAKQVEQRTEEWYKETKNIITASEISAIWKGPRTRAALVMSKVIDKDISVKRNTAFPRAQTGPMDWGVRYEPVVKQILEDTLGAKIQELGRIRHRSDPRVAASPDGLITESSKNPELIGSLVEIKCPPTRVINDKIPFEYWCQMQLQMEVCDRPSCEFVEVKFKELDADAVPSHPLHGWITLEGNQETMDMRYTYSANSVSQVTEGWAEIEKYQWEAVHLRRVTLQRDPVWFRASQGDLEAFWKDVEAARQGTWIPPPKKVKAKAAAAETGCAIVNSESDQDQGRDQGQGRDQDQPGQVPSYTDSSDSLRISIPDTNALSE
jgi:putative phage-type endonuclease